MSKSKILQIIPANGWRVLYQLKDETTDDKPLVCFALVEEEGETDVRPMEDGGGGGIMFCEDNPGNNIICLLAPDEESETVRSKRLKAIAQRINDLSVEELTQLNKYIDSLSDSKGERETPKSPSKDKDTSR